MSRHDFLSSFSFRSSRALSAGLAVFALIVPSFLPSISQASHLVRLDVGVFNGRTANMDTSNGTTFPFNTQNSTHVEAEWQYGRGKNFRFVLGGSYIDYKAPTNALIPSGVESQLLYGDIKAGILYATTWVEWRLLYSRFQMPFTYVYSVSNPTPTDPFARSYYLVPYTAPGDVFRIESVMYAKANAYRLAFHYYFALVSPVALPGRWTNHTGRTSDGQLFSRRLRSRFRRRR